MQIFWKEIVSNGNRVWYTFDFDASEANVE